MKKQVKAVLACLLAGIGAISFSGCDELLKLLEELPVLPQEDELKGYEFSVLEGNNDYFYRQLSDGQKSYYQLLHKYMEEFLSGNRQTKEYEFSGTTYHTLGAFAFSTYGLSATEGLEAFDAFYRDCPSFYVYDNVYVMYGETHLYPVIAEEYLQKSVRDSIDLAIEESVAQLAERIGDGYSAFDTFEIIHDYVAEQVEYEYKEGTTPSENAHAGNLVGVLDGDKTTNSICAGYSTAVLYLCNLFGVECIHMGNTALNHAWNLVKIDGAWYYADCTNDDGNRTKALFLCSEENYWKFFEYEKAELDNVGEGTVSTEQFLPKRSAADHSLLKFVRNAEGNSYSIVGVEREAELVHLPATRYGLPVTNVQNGAFNTSNAMHSLIFPQSITKIEFGAFSGAIQLQSVYYTGTEEEFSLIDKGMFNQPFAGASNYFYSENEPPKTEDASAYNGAYWYFGENGTPTVWVLEKNGIDEQ